MTETTPEPVLLDAIDDSPERGLDHPDLVTPEEVQRGLTLYRTLDDLDDDDNGLPDDDRRPGAAPGPVGAGRATALTRARRIRQVMLAYGVPEVSIELQAGRPTSGDVWNALDPVSAFSHHIASNPTLANPTPGLWLVKNGRADLGGPLANGTAGVDLVYRILTLGLANHPGFGGPLTVSGPLGAYTIPKDNARVYAWGTEYEGGYSEAVWDRVYTNPRTGIRMTFREFMGRCNAALAEALWLDGVSSRGKTPAPGMDLSGYHGEHKTWAPGRKPDRLNYSTESGRAELRKYATSTAREADMDLTDKNLRDIADAVWKHDGITVPDNVGSDAARKRNPTWQPSSVLTRLLRDVTTVLADDRAEDKTDAATRAQIGDIAKELDEGLASIAALVGRLGETEAMSDEERKALAADVAAQVNRLRVDVNVTEAPAG